MTCYKVFKMKRKLLYILSIFLIVNVTAQVSELTTKKEKDNTYAPSWNVNKNTERLFRNLVQSSIEKTPYFSAHFFYNYYSKSVLYKNEERKIVPLEISETDLKRVIRYPVGIPLLYGIDLAHCESYGWFQGEHALKRRATIISIVRKAWYQYGAVPIASWHLENPYTPHGFASIGIPAIYNSAHGDIVLSDSNIFSYPRSHKDVPREILSGIQYDDGVSISDKEHWLPSGTSTKCGKGRLQEGDDLEGYDSPRQWYENMVADLCYLINEFVDENGNGIPIILRLFHEPETKFAWWGYGVSKKTYKEFMRFTITKIREQCQNKNILFAYCKDRYWNKSTYADRYPGDDYIDIVGYDDYTICSSDSSDSMVIERMKIISSFAKDHNKVAALFETGNKTDYGKAHRFLSENLYNCIMAKGVNLGIVQIWSTFTTQGNENILQDYRDFLQKKSIKVFNKSE